MTSPKNREDILTDYVSSDRVIRFGHQRSVDPQLGNRSSPDQFDDLQSTLERRSLSPRRSRSSISSPLNYSSRGLERVVMAKSPQNDNPRNPSGQNAIGSNRSEMHVPEFPSSGIEDT